jgi:hypothetical protein
MGVSKPFRRTARQLLDGSYDNGNGGYVLHPKYAQAPEQYVRAFLVIQKDLQELFDYVEPSDSNENCYSYRIHELLLRSCVEVEANCKAILEENDYSRKGDWNMGDYKKINPSHHLHLYEVGIPIWCGTHQRRFPFAAWGTGGTLPWYDAYNRTKHDRHSLFHKATLGQMLDAICGLVALLASQFITEDFLPGPSYRVIAGSSDGLESAPGGYFRVKFPDNWPACDRYDINWQKLKSDADPFQNIVFPP